MFGKCILEFNFQEINSTKNIKICNISISIWTDLIKPHASGKWSHVFFKLLVLVQRFSHRLGFRVLFSGLEISLTSNFRNNT